jgi:branched-chain amino acid transport system permease protein
VHAEQVPQRARVAAEVDGVVLVDDPREVRDRDRGPALGGAIEDWFAYMLALAVLLFRPQGLFGEKIIERV